MEIIDMEKFTVVALLVVFLLSSCSAPATPTPEEKPDDFPTATPFPEEKPDDFQVIYEWETGSLPPPYYYKYTIQLGPAPEGKITFVADYPSREDPPPTWIETFEISEADLILLYILLYQADAFSEAWIQMEDIPVGGSADDLSVTAYGIQIQIPAYLDGEQKADSMRFIYKQIEARVPQETWDQLYTLHDAYVQANSDD
jgi:hypothetical protein